MGEKTDSPPLKKSQAFYFLFLPLTVQAEEMGQETKCNSLQEWQKIPDRRKVRQEAKQSGSSFLGEMQSYSCLQQKKRLERKQVFFSLSNVLFVILVEHPRKCRHSCVLILCCAIQFLVFLFKEQEMCQSCAEAVMIFFFAGSHCNRQNSEFVVVSQICLMFIIFTVV